MKFEYGEESGWINTTNDPADDHVVRVPTLRNLPLTAPYFHDGSAATLSEAVTTIAAIQLNRTLSFEETATLVAFLGSLIGDQPEFVLPFLPLD